MQSGIFCVYVSTMLVAGSVLQHLIDLYRNTDHHVIAMSVPRKLSPSHWSHLAYSISADGFRSFTACLYTDLYDKMVSECIQATARAVS